MPFVLGSNDRGGKSTKRRKLSPHSSTYPATARYSDADMTNHTADAEPEHTQLSASDSRPTRTEYPTEVVRTSSREELIECIKRGQRPAFVPQNGFQALREEEEALIASRRLRTDPPLSAGQGGSLPRPSEPVTSTAVPPSIQKPRSALHRGNFADSQEDTTTECWPLPIATDQPGLALSTSGNFNASPPSWLAAYPRQTSFDLKSHGRALGQLNTSLGARRRAPSLGSSLSSSFVIRTPTSPLVQATSNIDLDVSPAVDHSTHTPFRRDDRRRRTMPPNSFHSLSVTPIDVTPNFSRPFVPPLRREASMPPQSHRSAQSLSSLTYSPRSNLPTPWHHTRRPSMASDSPPRRRTSMVGSFEESILRGRMSTPPSRPLDFVAQIGVMGKGDCSSSLKCPAHVTVPFPAVFYSYPSSAAARSVSDDTPSPYVGTVDLSNNLKPVTLAVNKKPRLWTASSTSTETGPQREEMAKLHVGGAYRVPRQGQLQIIVKNPNKTAVKLFLVPYDLSDMDPGMKTFVRQRSFSSGPIIENVLGDKRSNPAIVDPLESKHILRYLIHIKFCCPAKNRFYLYDDIRVVFANRVPDGKEKLRNEVQLPDPKYSTWKSLKKEVPVKLLGSAPSTPTMTTFEVDSPQFFGDMDEIEQPTSPQSPTPSETLAYRKRRPPPHFTTSITTNTTPAARQPTPDVIAAKATPPLSFAFPDIERPTTPVGAQKIERARSPVTGFGTSTPLRASPLPWRSPTSGHGSTRSFSPINAEPAGDGLLSKQFRELNGAAGQQRPTSRSPDQ